MSRSHEAIRKAAKDRATEAEFSTAEGIFGVSYLLAEKAKSVPNGKASFGARAVFGAVEEQWEPDKRKLLFVSDVVDGAVREQFRSLRARLGQLQKHDGMKVLLVASALPGEGKSFVAGNLAHAFAVQRESKVVVVDADLRRGGLANLLGARATPGLSDYLRGKRALSEVVQAGLDRSLHFIPSGETVGEPGELISSSSLRDLIAQLRTTYDWIVIDTPPAVQFSDASVIADLCDGVILVLNAGATPAKLAGRALRAFKRQIVVGAVLNRCEESEIPTKYYGQYERATAGE